MSYHLIVQDHQYAQCWLLSQPFFFKVLSSIAIHPAMVKQWWYLLFMSNYNGSSSAKPIKMFLWSLYKSYVITLKHHQSTNMLLKLLVLFFLLKPEYSTTRSTQWLLMLMSWLLKYTYTWNWLCMIYGPLSSMPKDLIHLNHRSECQEMIENANIFLSFLKSIQHIMG